MTQPDDALNWDSGEAPDCEVEGGVSAPISTAGLRGRLTHDAPLAKLVWFKSGGPADWLFEPADLDDLILFLERLVPGVVIKLGKPFAGIEVDACTLTCGAGAHGILVASAARDAGVAGMEFMRGIPGTVGGFVRMNGGAYGREVADVLIDCNVVMQDGNLMRLTKRELDYSYRHSALTDNSVVVSARFEGTPGDPEAIGAEMDRIAEARETSQPLRTKTGGSTFKNPPGEKAWELVDKAGCRGMTVGGAQVSEKHTNFLINTGDATSEDIETLGEEVKRRVYKNSGVELEWEIRRVGRP